MPKRTPRRILGDPSEPISQALAFKVIGVILTLAVSLAVYIWSDLTSTVKEQAQESKTTDTKLWEKYGAVQSRQAEQAVELKSLGVQGKYIEAEVSKANDKLDRLLDQRPR